MINSEKEYIIIKLDLIEKAGYSTALPFNKDEFEKKHFENMPNIKLSSNPVHISYENLKLVLVYEILSQPKTHFNEE